MKKLFQYIIMMSIFVSFISLIPLLFPLERALSQNNEEYQEEWSDQSMNQRDHRPRHNKRHHRRKGGPLMRVLDTDRNSILSAEEIENASAALKKLDSDGDGNVTRYELHQINNNLDKANIKNRRSSEYNGYNDYNEYQ